MKTPLLLWDVDGTLLENPKAQEGSHLEEFLAAVSSATGKDNLSAPDKIDGSTDFAIIHSILENSGFSRKEADTFFVPSLLKLEKITTAPDLIARTRKPVSGALDILEFFKEGAISTYATGNSPFRAQAKVGFFEMDQYLDPSIGGFGWWTPKRSDFVARAITLAQDKFPEREFLPVVIGDTPSDIASAKELGISSIAVAAGVFSREELEKHQPSLVLDDLRDDAIREYLLA